jgi:cytochrome c oxidase cbb3-type subunit III
MKPHALAACALLLAVTGCTHLPGAPKLGVEVSRPDSITNFATLYGQNCAGCHGNNGQNGAAFDLANPGYQIWVDDTTLQKIIANGEPGTQMPAFAKSAGGFLTDAQVDVLVHGMRSNWQKSGAAGGQTPPPYAPTLKGDAAHGQQVYDNECAACHDKPSMSVINPTFLALINDQTLRTIIIAGRPDLGMPGWDDEVHEHPLTDQEVTDVVAWLASQRIQTPGQPYTHPQ